MKKLRNVSLDSMLDRFSAIEQGQLRTTVGGCNDLLSHGYWSGSTWYRTEDCNCGNGIGDSESGPSGSDYGSDYDSYYSSDYDSDYGSNFSRSDYYASYGSSNCGSQYYDASGYPVSEIISQEDFFNYGFGEWNGGWVDGLGWVAADSVVEGHQKGYYPGVPFSAGQVHTTTEHSTMGIKLTATIRDYDMNSLKDVIIEEQSTSYLGIGVAGLIGIALSYASKGLTLSVTLIQALDSYLSKEKVDMLIGAAQQGNSIRVIEERGELLTGHWSPSGVGMRVYVDGHYYGRHYSY